MTTPAFQISANANANAASAARATQAGFDAPAQEVDGRDGGFAEALDEVTNEAALGDANAIASSAPSSDLTPHDAVTVAALAPSAATPSGADSPLPGSAMLAEATAAAAEANAASASGWPPPGLASLFPSGPLFAPGASAALPSAALASPVAPPVASARLVPPALASTTPVVTASPANRMAPPLPTRLDDGAVPVPPDLLGPVAPQPAPLAANAPALDPISAALARQPAALRLPIADEGAITGIATLVEALAPERLPDGAAPLSASTTPLPRLDLAQAFPAPVALPSKPFAEDLGARLQWMAAQQGGEATLRIAPEGLGPVEIRLKLDGERVDLGFSASQAETRQALEQSLPKLREMLAQQGLQLGDANVGQHHAGHAQEGAAKGERGFGDDEGGIVSGAAPRVNEAAQVIGRGTRGVLDLYA